MEKMRLISTRGHASRLQNAVAALIRAGCFFKGGVATLDIIWLAWALARPDGLWGSTSLKHTDMSYENQMNEMRGLPFHRCMCHSGRRILDPWLGLDPGSGLGLDQGSGLGWDLGWDLDLGLG